MFWQRKELVCQEMVELITDYLEGALSRSQRRRFDAHIAACENCTEYLRQMRATIRLTGRLRAEDMTPAMREELTALYQRWREEEEEEEEEETTPEETSEE
jgi:anti-sigma factor RsiW